MNSPDGKMGTYGLQTQCGVNPNDPLHFVAGLPWWARKYDGPHGLSPEEKIALAKASEKEVIWGYAFYLEKERTGVWR